MGRRSGAFIGEILRLLGYPLYVALVHVVPFLILLLLGAIGQLSHHFKRLFHQLNRPLSTAKQFVLRRRVLVPTVLLALLVPIIISIFTDLPSPDDLKSRQPKLTTHILDRNGNELYKIYKDENRSLVTLSELPEYVIDATVAIEDKEFWNHPGFSFIGISRALRYNLTKSFRSQSLSSQLQGGSTITQQLVKNTLLTPEQTLRRKARELVLALWIEKSFTKKEILQMYLNEVSYGGTAYGIQEAAQQYFGKDAQGLSLAEAALLAGLPAAPTTFSPLGAHPEQAWQRQDDVLRNMVSASYITREQAEEARAQKIVLKDGATNIKAPHFVMFVRDYLVELFGEDAVNHGGLKVTTTLDLPLQEFVQQTVSAEVTKLRRLNVTNGAALATNPATGEVLAMVGSKDYFDFDHDGQVNVTVRPRQPGSSIKPLMYAAALQRGYTPASILMDAPVSFPQPGGKPYRPVNYDQKFHGPVPLRVALGSSYNVPAVKVLSAIGVETMIDQAESLGITTWQDRGRFGLSLTLGGGEITMLDMVEAYGTLANAGIRVPVTPIVRVEDSTRKVWYEPPTDRLAIRALPATIAYQLTDMLADPAARAPAFGTQSVLNIPGHQVAVKTGTTNNLRDNWAFGYTSEIVIASWVGNNNNAPMSYIASGITGASPIWATVMKGVLSERSTAHVFSKPGDLVTVKICTLTGQLACQGCPVREEVFLPGTEPTQACQPDISEDQKQLLKEASLSDQQEMEKQRQQRDRILDGAQIEREKPRRQIRM